MNTKGVFSGTFSGCEISKNAGSVSGTFTSERDDSGEEGAAGAGEAGAGSGSEGEAEAPKKAAGKAKAKKASSDSDSD